MNFIVDSLILIERDIYDSDKSTAKLISVAVNARQHVIHDMDDAKHFRI